MFKPFRSLVLLAVVAVASIASVVSATARWVYAGAVALARDTFVGPVDLVATEAATPQRPLVQARAFVLRLLKRERPVITNDWRLCPST